MRVCVCARAQCELCLEYTHAYKNMFVSTDAHLCLGLVHTPPAHLPLKVHFSPRDVPSLPARVLPRGEASISPAEAASHSAPHRPRPCVPSPAPTPGPASSPRAPVPWPLGSTSYQQMWAHSACRVQPPTLGSEPRWQGVRLSMTGVSRNVSEPEIQPLCGKRSPLCIRNFGSLLPKHEHHNQPLPVGFPLCFPLPSPETGGTGRVGEGCLLVLR